MVRWLTVLALGGSTMANDYDADDAYELDLDDAAGPTVDAAHEITSQYIESAEANLAEAKRPPDPPRFLFVQGVFTYPWHLKTLATWILMSLAVTAAALIAAFCYHLLNVMFLAGRIIALPTGMICAATLSYASGCYMAVMLSTSEGIDEFDEWLESDWKSWFWTLPASAGMLVVSAVCGYGLSELLPISPVLVVAATTLVLYPVLQLSTLETGSIVSPFSRAVLGSLGRCPIAWAIFYAEWMALGIGFLYLSYVTWHDPPYISILFMGPVASALILIYARLLGRMAWSISASERGRRSK